jgi:hypothetical protein
MRNPLLRVPFLRWCALQHLKKVRHERRERAWAETQAVLVALGNITIHWAGINLILNRFIEGHRFTFGPVIRDELPRSFTGKLDYLEKVEKTLTEPATAAQFRAFRLELAELNEQRINVVHGLLRRRGYGPRWTIHIAKEVKDRLHRNDIPSHSNDIHALARRLSDVSHRLATFFRPMFGK